MCRMQGAIIIAWLLAGCSATPMVTAVAPGETSLKGIPMRVKREHIVRLFEFDPVKDTYSEVSTSRQVLADQSRLYAVNINAEFFSSPTLHIGQNADNTLKILQAASVQTGTTAIDAASTTATSIAGARTTAVTTQNTITAACQVSNTAVITADQAVATARASYDQLPATASQELRDAYLSVIESAKRAADYARASSACR